MPGPTYIYYDLMQSYSVGPGAPSGFEISPGTGTSEFVDAFDGKSGIVYEIGIGQIWYPQNSPYYPTSALSMFWTVWGPGLGANINVTDPISFIQQTLAQLVLESDFSISLVLFGGNSINTLRQVVFAGVWQYFQWDITIGTITVGGNSYYTVDSVLTIDGVEVLNTSSPLTSTLIVNGNVGANVNQFGYSSPFGAIGTSYLAEIAATAGVQTPPFYINPGSPINARASQLVVESIGNKNGLGRFSQGVVESLGNKIPNARMSQSIVEILYQTPGSGGGSRVYES